MRRTLGLLVAVAALGIAACLTDNFEGTKCDADHACAPGLACVDGFCRTGVGAGGGSGGGVGGGSGGGAGGGGGADVDAGEDGGIDGGIDGGNGGVDSGTADGGGGNGTCAAPTVPVPMLISPAIGIFQSETGNTFRPTFRFNPVSGGGTGACPLHYEIRHSSSCAGSAFPCKVLPSNANVISIPNTGSTPMTFTPGGDLYGGTGSTKVYWQVAACAGPDDSA
ncbi:MAG: hypothetical protein ACJ790_23075, partial [Myxococcaceae bacterium]